MQDTNNAIGENGEKILFAIARGHNAGEEG